MKNVIRVVIIVIILGLLAGGSYLGYNYYTEQEAAQELADLQTVEAERGNLTATVGATGTVRSNQTAVLTWLTSGTIETIGVSIGDLVNKDQALAELEATSLPQNVILAQADLVNAQQALEDLQPTAYALSQAEYQVVKMQDSVDKAQERLDSLGQPASQVDIDVAEATVLLAKIQLDKAQKDFKPWEKKPADNPIRASLYNKLVAAQKNYDSAVRRLNNLKGQGVNADERELAQADLDLAQANLAEAVRKLEELKAGPQAGDIQVLEARIQAAEATLRTRQLRALFTATVTDILVMPGDQVSPGKAAFRLDDLSRLVVDVLISEVDINRIQVGQEVVLTFDAILGKEYSGQVTEVSRVGASTQGLVEFKVSVQLIDPDETVRPGMTAAVNIVINELDDVLLVPNRAVRVLEGKRVVYLLVDSELEPVEITLGASSETFSEVTDGELKPGDIIVLNPPTEFESDGPPPFVR